MPLQVKFKLDQGNLLWQPSLPVEVLHGRAVPGVADPVQSLAHSLRHPAAGPALAEYLSGKHDVVLVVSDHTRAVGYRQFLPALLDEINQCGISDANISLLVAVGLHEPQAEAKTLASLGETICQRVRVDQHRCNVDEELGTVTLAHGASVRINRRLLDRATGGGARGVILTGGITFHYHAGFGGGRKAIFPGCAAYEDVLANHRRLLDPAGPRGRNPNCQPGQTDGNPIYEESVAVLKACPPMFLVNSVLTVEGQIAAFFSGDPIGAHRIGCDFLHRNFTSEIGAAADLVIAGAGGAPKDVTLYQAHKAYDNASRAVCPGGAVVLVAGLREGLGGAAFRRGLQHATLEEHRNALFGSGYTIPSQTCLACREKAERARTWIVGVRKEHMADLKQVGFHPATSMDQALVAALDYLRGNRTDGASPRTLVMPDAGQLLPVIKDRIAAI